MATIRRTVIRQMILENAVCVQPKAETKIAKTSVKTDLCDPFNIAGSSSWNLSWWILAEGEDDGMAGLEVRYVHEVVMPPFHAPIIVPVAEVGSFIQIGNIANQC